MSTDRELLERITFNPAIFGGKAMFHHAAHAGIIRLNRVRPADYVSETRRAISLHGADLEAAAVVIIDRGEMRIRRTD
jgi:hypothetical protein